jgi:XRE family transcriptional regulator, stress-response regulator
VLLRRVIGDALRARRQAQHRTLREVSGAANVSLGYLSEIERGQKEASSELLASICDALGAQLSEVFREVSNTFAVAEQVERALAPAGHLERTLSPAEQFERALVPADHPAPGTVADLVAVSTPVVAELVSVPAPSESIEELVDDDGGVVKVTVRHEAPLKTTLRTVRNVRSVGGDRERDIIFTG